MARRYPEIVRGTPEYDEVARFVVPRYNGKRRGFVLDESVEQISERYLKGDVVVLDDRGDFVVRGDEVAARRRRIRIPSDSWLADARCRIA
ncbi:hypothetical protein DW322_00870 [Rhodococcus rhodnii]|uniref:Uncharacterized protein n=2 Tax=Rhodococcus rhodnii TaxID=38312 RepID=R7WPP3_9NOCA|nr:hypothetical protein [Rhodococcus rhodnii]EOM77286.1 hypothetical protein Rrhod_1348 [Rhodococcus rhodnii LMG 5362]TXG89056.1 hypothetical protein DW322_00870 [Rhodococcus rhodnii]